jgi:hypothetical protein
MIRRMAIWTGIGFLMASGWVLYSSLTPPEQFIAMMREPLVQALAYASCPIIFAAQRFPLHFWWVPPINAATYTLIGLITEGLIALSRLLHRQTGLASSGS